MLWWDLELLDMDLKIPVNIPHKLWVYRARKKSGSETKNKNKKEKRTQVLHSRSAAWVRVNGKRAADWRFDEENLRERP